MYCYLDVLLANNPFFYAVVNLPSPNHHWFVTNDSIASIDPVMGIVDATAIETTNILVEDLRVVGNQQTTTLHTVIPNELHLYLSLFTRLRGVLNGEDLVSCTTPWYFVVGREYVVHLKAFSWQSSAQPLYLTEVCVMKTLLILVAPYLKCRFFSY